MIWLLPPTNATERITAMKYAIRTALAAAVVMTAYACTKPATAEPVAAEQPAAWEQVYTADPMAAVVYEPIPKGAAQ